MKAAATFRRSRLLAALFVTILAAGCAKARLTAVPDTEKENGRIYSITKNVRLSTSDLAEIVDSDLLKPRMKYGVTCYNVGYWTKYVTDDFVKTNALLIVPDYAPGDTMRFAAYFHGTILPMDLGALLDTGTPSSFDGTGKSKDILYCALPLASAGYCVITPDYTGYGATADRDHPFIYYPELFKSCIDGLYAARTALNDSLRLNMDTKNIWISGWSQGGGAALYMQRLLESDYAADFNVKATSTLAGPFDINFFMDEVFRNSDKFYPQLALYSWAGYAINRFDMDAQRPTDQIFRLRVFDQRSSFLLLTLNPKELFQDFFIKNILNGNDVTFIEAMKKCSTAHGWCPKAPVYMHHGTSDNLVPYSQMENAYYSLKEENGDGCQIYMWKKVGGGHDTFVPEYISDTIDKFVENR